MIGDLTANLGSGEDAYVSENKELSRADADPPGRLRWTLGAVLVPLAFVLLWFAPLPLEPRAHRLVAIFAAVLIAWVTEVIPVAATSLMIAPMLLLCGITDAATAFRYYADPLLYLFVGGFMLAESMRRHGLDRRFATAMVSLPFIRDEPLRMQVAMIVAAVIMSMWISNTATCAIMMPILLGMPGLERPQKPGASDPATGPLLAIGYACSTAGLGTLLGTPPNLITVRLLAESGIQIGFVEWLSIGVPAAILLSIAAAFITIRRNKEPFPGGMWEPRVEPWSRGEKWTAGAFMVAVVGWTFPPFAQLFGVPFADELDAALHPGAVAILACLPLFFVPERSSVHGVGGAPPILPWSTAVRIDWGVILLFGGGISLGTQLEQTGLARTMASAVVNATGPTDVWTLAAIACFATVVLSEVASNTAAANILVPLVIALSTELHISPIPPVLAVGMGASIGFMLPIATGPNALIFGTGRVPQVAMMRAGFVLDIVCWVLVLLLLRLICPLMGWV